jgi:hypothetical protein
MKRRQTNCEELRDAQREMHPLESRTVVRCCTPSDFLGAMSSGSPQERRTLRPTRPSERCKGYAALSSRQPSNRRACGLLARTGNPSTSEHLRVDVVHYLPSSSRARAESRPVPLNDSRIRPRAATVCHPQERDKLVVVRNLSRKAIQKVWVIHHRARAGHSGVIDLRKTTITNPCAKTWRSPCIRLTVVLLPFDTRTTTGWCTARQHARSPLQMHKNANCPPVYESYFATDVPAGACSSIDADSNVEFSACSSNRGLFIDI